MFNTVIRRSITTTAARRHYATTPQAFHVFNREAKKLQKDRAAMNVEESRTVDYLKDEIAARVADRLLVKHTVFLGFQPSHHPCLLGHQPRFRYSGRFGVWMWTYCKACYQGYDEEAHHVRHVR